MSFFGQHEFAGAGERLEPGFSQSRQLIFAITIGEHGERIKVEPVITGLIERFQDARFVRVPAAPLEQRISLVAPVASEVSLQQIHHGPEMTSFFNVRLEKIAQVIERRTGVAQLSLLFDGSRLSVSLGDDDAAERIAELTRYFLVSRRSVVITKADFGVSLLRFEE